MGSIAMESMSFVVQVKALLGFRAGREVIEGGEGYQVGR